MISIETITRVCNWNAARYAREVNPALQRNLLVEEYNETVKAIEDSAISPAKFVEVLDGVGDILFVAIGGLWKHGLSPKAIQFCVSRAIKSQPLTNDELTVGILPNKYDMYDNLAFINVASQLTDMSLDSILQCICTSNETKEVVKTDTGIKANINKGAGFVPPTADLEKLIDEFGSIIAEVQAVEAKQ